MIRLCVAFSALASMFLAVGCGSSATKTVRTTVPSRGRGIRPRLLRPSSLPFWF
jgi:hypothetical protein